MKSRASNWLLQKVNLTTTSKDPESVTFGGDEVQSLVDVGDLVEPHLAAVGLGQRLPGDDLEQQHQLETVAEVVVDVLDAGAGLAQVAVAPCCEGLERDNGV